MDFIRGYKCILDFSGDQDLLILTDGVPREYCIPLKDCPELLTMTLPARSEVVRAVRFDTDVEDVFVPQQMIQHGVFIANTITKKSKPLVRIINVTDEDIVIKKLRIEVEKLSDYKIANVSSGGNHSHKSEKLARLAKNFPDFVKPELTQLCSDYSDIFALESDKITTNNFYKQKLRLNDKQPVYIKNYRTPYSQKEEINKQVQKLVDDNIVEPSTSDYNSPLLLVPKKALPGTNQKRWRLVVDYRGVNKKLMADKFPLPRIDDILDQLGRAKYFSCLDLISGFHQIELEEESRDITSFSTDTGSFRFKRLPYGLKIAPNSFQRMMTLAFSGLSPVQAFVYMDDLIVIGCSTNHMIQNLKDVFNLCRKYNLKLHPDKCFFFRQEVTFLGHKCTNKGILPDDAKFSIIKNYPTPKNGDEAKRFIAFCNYYRRFIPYFAEYSRHITRLSRKNVKFEWTTECEKSFNYFKTQLLSPHILQYPDFTKQFYLTTDASKHACGAVLSQETEGIQMPIAFASKAFTKGESNKSTIEQELTAIHWAIQYFRPYIYGKKFVIRTDHKPLSYLFSLKNPSSKLTRMRLDLEEYDFSIEYLRGKDNHAADALSRIEFNDIRNIEVKNVLKVTTRLQAKRTAVDKTDSNKQNQKLQPDKLKVYEAINALEYRRVPQLHLTQDKLIILKGKKKLSEHMLNEMIVNGNVDLGHLFPRLEKIAGNLGLTTIRLSQGDRLFNIPGSDIESFKSKGNGLLKRLTLVLTPKLEKVKNAEDRLKIMRQYHDDPISGGHCGITRMIRKIRLLYYWKGMTRDITKYVKQCRACQRNKPSIKGREPLVITPTPVKPFEIVIVDTIGPLPRSNSQNEYAVTIMCDLTKYLVAVPIDNKSARSVAKAIMEGFILVYGPMKKIVTDMGTEYMNQVLKELCVLMRIEKLNSTPYHHETLGTVERSHRTFNEYLRSYMSEDKSDWDEWLKFFVYCYNTTPSTAHEYCPFELVFGKTPPIFDFNRDTSIAPLYNTDSYEKEVKFRLQVAHRRAASLIESAKLRRRQDSSNTAKPLNIAPNDWVLVTNESGHKLDPVYKGPYIVMGLPDNNNVELQLQKDDGKPFVVHKNRIKKFYG